MPCERFDRNKFEFIVEEAVERKPFVNPKVVEVELPQYCEVKGKVLPPPDALIVIEFVVEEIVIFEPARSEVVK